MVWNATVNIAMTSIESICLQKVSLLPCVTSLTAACKGLGPPQPRKVKGIQRRELLKSLSI